ncbi:murein biosynthesis integral membrane protein MurJ [Patescibacteria group bacterium]
MVGRLITQGKKILNSQQNTVLSAAGVIMIMIIASRILGLVRQRVLANFFAPGELSLFFAAFRLPDTIFEVLVFGTFASAFIPIFTKNLKVDKNKAWELGGLILNWGGLIFLVLATVVIIFAHPLYRIITPGFGQVDQETIANLARILFAAQGFFVLSYVLTAVLESSKRFLVPALAPIFYNLGIIVFTIVFSGNFHLMAPVLGVVVGAGLHFLVQLPLAIKLGFRFSMNLKITPDVKKIAKLAMPRILEVSFLQIAKFVELSLATLISIPAYTFFTFGNSIQLIPVGLFGTSIAKAALPTLARQADDLAKFKKTLFETLNQVVFLMAPVAAFLIVARIPVVRLVFGTDLFTWESTVQTSLVVSAFAVGVFSQAANSILARSFYALHDTKTPVMVSIGTLTLNIVLDVIFVYLLKLPVWSLAAAFSFASILQSVILFGLIVRKIDNGAKRLFYIPVIKSLVSASVSGLLMFLILKFFDRSVWIKKLSFITYTNLPFEKFVLDTRYATNLIILTTIVGVAGIVVYMMVSYLLKSSELKTLIGLIKKTINRQKYSIEPHDVLDIP